MKMEVEHVRDYLLGKIKRKSVNWNWYRKVFTTPSLLAELNAELFRIHEELDK